MTYKKARIKFKIEYLLMLPFVVAGRLFGKTFPLRTQHDVFLFFPNGDIGGSPQVNIDLTHCLKHKNPLIIFSKKPSNNGFRHLYNIQGTRIIDLHRLIDIKVFHFINFFYRGVIAEWIRSQPKSIIIGGESLFFYKMLQHVPTRTKKIEICHLSTWIGYSIGHIDNIDKRVFSTLYLKKQVEAQYKKNGLSQEYYKRLHFIDNSIPIPNAVKRENNLLEIVFIGRGAPQKRVHLVAAIAKRLHEENAPTHFSFVGDVENSISISLYPYCKFYGNISDQLQLERIYEASDVLILTSAFEGLPVVVMKMMAYGKTIISTAVNGIPDYIIHMENGLLIYSTDEDEIINEGVNNIKYLLQTPSAREKYGRENRKVAMERFSNTTFCKSYLHLIET